jgi:glutamyl-tRNA synthetase
MNAVRVRFAPSPTGFLHIGGLRTALYDYLFAKKNKGTLILRIEDTDQNRKVDGAVENLLDTFKKLGIDFDEGPMIGGNYGPYYQSQRLNLYHKYADELIKQGLAYHCFCTAETLETMRKDLQAKKLFPKYDRRCLNLSENEVQQRIARGDKFVIRLRMPDDRVFQINDEIRGLVEIDTSQLDDQVIIKSDGFPTYHLASVVDDHLMEISHVIRGEEWLSSTPKHIYLYECFKWTEPKWVHLPLILNPDRSKLSKRMNDVAVDSYLTKGYLKEALLNFVALLGWHGADDRELYSLSELFNEFSLERVNKAGAVFDLTKLDWMNGQYIRSLPLELIADLCKPYFHSRGINVTDEQKYLKVIAVARNYATLLPDVLEYSLQYYMEPELEKLQVNLSRYSAAHDVISMFLSKLSDTDITDNDAIKEIVNHCSSTLGLKGKDIYHPLRLSLFYTESGPEIPIIINVLGIQESKKRLQTALKLCQPTVNKE